MSPLCSNGGMADGRHASTSQTTNNDSANSNERRQWFGRRKRVTNRVGSASVRSRTPPPGQPRTRWVEPRLPTPRPADRCGKASVAGR
jgi:hypothetical protein